MRDIILFGVASCLTVASVFTLIVNFPDVDHIDSKILEIRHSEEARSDYLKKWVDCLEDAC